MKFDAQILLDSITPNGTRLTTMRVTMPRFILAEFNTHRVFSRNAGSSRAISVKRRLEGIRESPFIPVEWGLERRGMSAETEISDDKKVKADLLWREAASRMCDIAQEMAGLNVHKQVVNRLLEPFSWVDVIVSSTLWDNFFLLRRAAGAQPEMRALADVMWDTYTYSVPTKIGWNSWHIPLISEAEQLQIGNNEQVLYAAAGRCARVSYQTSSEKPWQDDVALAKQLLVSGHWSPFEHIARARQGRANECRNFVKDWDQFRGLLE